MNLSPLARQLYDVLKAHSPFGTWAGTENELASLAGLKYPIDRAISSELIDAKLIAFRCVGPLDWWLKVNHQESEAAR